VVGVGQAPARGGERGGEAGRVGKSGEGSPVLQGWH